VALLILLIMELRVPGPLAVLGALAAALSASIWVDASLAEVHTLTLALSVASLWLALRYGRDGERSDLLWLTFVFSQGLVHQRSLILLAPALLVLIWPHFLDIFRLGWRTLALIAGITLLAPLTYLYLPLRVWTGADWVFGAPGTWDGFWTLFFDNRADRIFDLSTEWGPRLQTSFAILADDMPWPLLGLGLLALWLPALEKRAWRVSLGLTLSWLPYLLLTVLIWRNRVVDAQLAAKLPLLLLAGVGLALLLDWLRRRSAVVGAVAATGLAVALLLWARQTRPFVLDITRDPTAEGILDTMTLVAPAPDGRPTTVVLPWGDDYWAMSYAQAFDGRFPDLTIVDHNADPRRIIARGDRLLIPNQTFLVFPPAYYEERLGPLHLSSAAPGVTEISPAPIPTAADGAAAVAFDLQNGAQVQAADVAWLNDEEILLTIYWQTAAGLDADYNVAVHLLAQDPPQGPDDILDQDDRVHPVDNWYPTTQWQPGDVVRDTYLLKARDGRTPAALRLSMYRPDGAGGFSNTPWLSIPLPPRPAATGAVP
jgi:hypothetical protein